jgi:hypothetical protein
MSIPKGTGLTVTDCTAPVIAFGGGLRPHYSYSVVVRKVYIVINMRMHFGNKRLRNNCVEITTSLTADMVFARTNREAF